MHYCFANSLNTDTFTLYSIWDNTTTSAVLPDEVELASEGKAGLHKPLFQTSHILKHLINIHVLEWKIACMLYQLV